jgi:LysR family hydrogen peroxide-inducible transcriptional activator
MELNLQELQYFVAVAEYLHFGRAAESCHVSQPTLSGQLKKLELRLGVSLFERTNKRVALTPAGAALLGHAQRSIEEARLVEVIAKSARDPLQGPLRVGVIPTLAPYVLPKILGPLRKLYPQMQFEPWEDMTASLLEMLRASKLDAALIATEVEGDLTSVVLFADPFLAALPKGHRFAGQAMVQEAKLAPDLLVLAEGHCLAMQALSACKQPAEQQGTLRAVSLETLVNLVAAGYGTTLIPKVAEQNLTGRGVVLRPLVGGAARTIRLASRGSFPRPQALRALEKVILRSLPGVER